MPKKKTAVAEPQKPCLRCDVHPDHAEDAAAAVEFVESNDFEAAVRKIVEAHAEPGCDFADVDGKRYVATADGVVQVAVPREIDGKTIYEILIHSRPEEVGPDRRLECCRGGSWRDDVLAKASKINRKVSAVAVARLSAAVSPFRGFEA